MANYLVAKCGNTTSSYSLRNEIPSSGPYLRVSNGYLPLTTDTKSGIQVKVNNKTYNIQESYTTTELYTVGYSGTINTTIQYFYSSLPVNSSNTSINVSMRFNITACCLIPEMAYPYYTSSYRNCYTNDISFNDKYIKSIIGGSCSRYNKAIISVGAFYDNGFGGSENYFMIPCISHNFNSQSGLIISNVNYLQKNRHRYITLTYSRLNLYNAISMDIYTSAGYSYLYNISNFFDPKYNYTDITQYTSINDIITTTVVSSNMQIYFSKAKYLIYYIRDTSTPTKMYLTKSSMTQSYYHGMLGCTLTTTLTWYTIRCQTTATRTLYSTDYTIFTLTAISTKSSYTTDAYSEKNTNRYCLKYYGGYLRLYQGGYEPLTSYNINQLMYSTRTTTSQ